MSNIVEVYRCVGYPPWDIVGDEMTTVRSNNAPSNEKMLVLV